MVQPQTTVAPENKTHSYVVGCLGVKIESNPLYLVIFETDLCYHWRVSGHKRNQDSGIRRMISYHAITFMQKIHELLPSVFNVSDLDTTDMTDMAFYACF